MAVPPTAEKKVLRRELRAVRRAFALEHVFVKPTESIAATLRAWIVSARCVAGYCAVAGEPDVMPMLEFAAENDVMTALPRITGDAGAMDFRIWAAGDVTEVCGTFRQPLRRAAQIVPDLILVPLLGFDRALNRLGQGGGHYDRAFAAYPKAKKVGIAWSVQEVAAIPTEPHDVQLDAVLTEKEFIW